MLWIPWLETPQQIHNALTLFYIHSIYYSMPESNGVIGGFQLEFVSISRVINHMTCYNVECSH